MSPTNNRSKALFKLPHFRQCLREKDIVSLLTYEWPDEKSFLQSIAQGKSSDEESVVDSVDRFRIQMRKYRQLTPEELYDLFGHVETMRQRIISFHAYAQSGEEQTPQPVSGKDVRKVMVPHLDLACKALKQTNNVPHSEARNSLACQSLIRRLCFLEDIVFKTNVRLVWMCARKSYYNEGLVADLLQEGSYGLHIATLKYNRSKGVAFSVYALPWIRRYIKMYALTRVPIIKARVDEQALERRVFNATRYLEFRDGRAPESDEVAKFLGLSQKSKKKGRDVEGYIHIPFRRSFVLGVGKLLGGFY